MNTMIRLIALLASVSLLASCVDHRPVRNGLRDESTYLTKADFTGVNPKIEDSTDPGWLFKTTVVKTSSPNMISAVAFPGLESDLGYVKLRFQEGSLQVIDGRAIQRDLTDDHNDDLATQTDRVIISFPGTHVDVRLQESLDGERTNRLEENTERPWAERKNFKVDFEKTNMEPASQLLWIYGLYAQFCAIPRETVMVPNSFEWDAEAQYLSFVLDVTYEMNWAGWVCADLLGLYEHNASTTNVQYRMSFFRPDASDYEPEIIEEKALVNKKYGSFQTANIFRDPESGLMGNVNLINRWNPKGEEKITFYFHQGFPERFKPMFAEIADRTNEVFTAAGTARQVEFLEWNHDGIERNFGDLRYSFVIWHQGIDQTMGLLGYGPSSAIPQTGEIISASLNLYEVGLDRYRFYIQDYLEEHGGLLQPDADTQWEDTTCVEGATVAPGDPVRCAIIAEGARNTCEADGGADCDAAYNQAETECKQAPRLTTQLFNEMRRVMDIDVADGSADDFVPQPQNAGFRDNLHRTLSEIRYAYPPWNRYVYRTASPAQELQEREAKDREFMDTMATIQGGQNPFGAQPLHTQGGIQAQVDFSEKMRDWKTNHQDLQALKDHLHATRSIYTFDPNDAINAISMGARRCIDRSGSFTWESNDEYRERIIEAVVFQVAIHEFGHNLSLRHNFYGSVDAKHMREGDNSASVMDYVTSWEEAGSSRGWGPYDEAALSWIYGGETVREEQMAKDLLYCTDEHRILSPLCTAHDLGVTPAQITLNAIERYDWLYKLRNRRAYRTFWDTSGYVGSVYGSLFPIQRMWHLALFDWGGGGVQGTLKRLDQTNGSTVLTDQEYDEISVDFYNDISASVGMTTAFYDAIINQSATFRNYQTEYDPFYGDVLRMGIIIDKLFATLAFMDQGYVYYSPNVATYVSMWDAPFGSQNAALTQRVLDNMLGANYDTFAWFKYYALGLYASAANSNLANTVEAKERIAIERFENLSELYEVYGEADIAAATAGDNPQGTFIHNAEQYIYTYLPDRNWHLVARKSRSPVSYQYMREYNEDLSGADEDLDNYGLKILLAYHEYFNNFVGF